MRINKIISVSITLVFVISLYTAPMHVFATEKNTEAIGLLEKIGIISVDEFDEDAYITRIDYLSLVLKALKLDTNMHLSNAEQIFLDIQPDDENSGFISTAYRLNIIKGQSDGRFCPDNNITVTEAVVIAVRALGCEKVAESFGGYPVGYMVCAGNVGLLEDFSEGANKTVSNADCARLIFNMLNAKRLKTNNGNDFFFDEDKTYLSQNYNITRATGVVDANSYGKLYGGKPLESGKISVDNVIYDVPDEYDGLYIGLKVVFYYEDDNKASDRKIVYMYEKNNNVEMLDIEDITSVKSGELRYINGKGDNEAYDIDPKAVILENGVRTVMPETGLDLPKQGTVKIIDNSKDGYYDVILIFSYKTGIVKFVSESTIYFANNANYNVNLEDFDRYTIKDKDGKSVEVSNLKPDSVLNVYESSDKSLVEILVSIDTALIEVNEIFEENNGYPYKKVVCADGTEYRTVRDFSSLLSANDISIGMKYKVALDVYGRIAVVLKNGDERYKYGYLYDWDKAKPGIDETAAIRVFTSEGNFVNIIAEKRVKNEGNGVSMSPKELLDACTSRQVIRYSLNESGKLRTIEFPASDPTSLGFKVGGSTSTANNGLSRYFSATALIGANIAVDKQTKIFLIPKENADNEDLYYATDITSLANERYYPNTTAYVYGDDIYAKVLIRQSEVTTVSRDGGRMLVTAFAQSYDEKKQKVSTIIKGFADGKERSLALGCGTDLSYTTASKTKIPIEAGDVIRYETNIYGEITYIKLVFDSSTSTLYGLTDGNDDNVAYGSDVTHTYGQVSRKIDNYICVKRNGQPEESPYLYPITADTNIYEYDAGRQTGKNARIINAGDIVSLQDKPANSDRIVMITRTGTVPFIVIYK